MLLDLGFILDEEGVPITIKRKSGGDYNEDGDWSGETLTEEADVAVVQPAMGQRLLDLPEGERNEARFFLWSKKALVSDDVVNYGGADYRIVHIWPRQHDGGYTRAAIGKQTA